MVSNCPQDSASKKVLDVFPSENWEINPARYVQCVRQSKYRQIGKALTALLRMKREQLPGSEITQINNSPKADLRRAHSLAPVGG